MSSEADFIAQWTQTFPHEPVPDVTFLLTPDLMIERSKLCKERIEEASRVTRRERFTLNWLSDYKKRHSWFEHSTGHEQPRQDVTIATHDSQQVCTPSGEDDALEWPLISPPSSRTSSTSSGGAAACDLMKSTDSNNAGVATTNVSAAQLDKKHSMTSEINSSKTSGGASPSVAATATRQLSETDVFAEYAHGAESPRRSLSLRSSSSDFDMEIASSPESPRPKPRMRPKPLPRPKRRPSGTILQEEDNDDDAQDVAIPDKEALNHDAGERRASTGVMKDNHIASDVVLPTVTVETSRHELATAGEEQTNVVLGEEEQSKSTSITESADDILPQQISAEAMDAPNSTCIEKQPDSPTRLLITDDNEPATFEHKNLHDDDAQAGNQNVDSDTEKEQDPSLDNKEDEEDAWVAALELGSIGQRTRSKKRQDDRYKVVKGVPPSFDQMQDEEEIYENYDAYKTGSLRGHRRAPLVKPELSDDSDTNDDPGVESTSSNDDTGQEPSFRHMTLEEIEKLKKWQSDEDIFQSLQREGESDDSDLTSSPVLKRDMKGPRQNKKSSLTRQNRESIDEEAISKPTICEESSKTDSHEEEETEEFKNIHMRKLLVMDLVDSERSYVDCLDMLRKFMKPIQKSTETSQPILTIVDFNNIFFGVDDLYRFHQMFMPQMESRVERWSANQIIGDVLSVLMDGLDLYRAFINNYQVSQEAIMKCRHANATFDDIMKKDIRIPSLKEPIKLEGLLYKPVYRMTQYSLILNDFLKCTSDNHPDHALLVEVTANLFDLFEQVNVSRDKKGSTQRHFLKEGFVVELDNDGERKARNLLLFSDCLICAKLKPSKDALVCKWYAALADLHLKPSELSEAPQTVPVTTKVECDRLRASICNLRVELKKEQMPLSNTLQVEGSPPVMKRRKEGSFSVSSTKVNNRTIEKIKRKLQEQENLLKLIAPSLPWTLYHRNGKTVTLLLLNEGERHAWKEVLVPRIKKMVSRGQNNFSVSNAELQRALEDCLKIQRFSARFASALPTPYFESRNSSGTNTGSKALTGYLYVHIIGGRGFRNSDTYCVLEVDCYNNFFRKAKTKPCKGPEPQWDEGFEMELESALNLRILCYNRIRLMLEDVCGKASIDLSRENLVDGRQHQLTVSLDKQGSVTMALSFSTNPDDIQRESMSADIGVFGVPIQVVSRRERFEIPLIVITCVKEIEKRGRKEVGIYRLSGISSEIQMLKKSFNENPQSALVDVAEADIHAVAGLLKLYFRELPDPLFTADLYSKLIEAANISDVEEKDLYLCELIQQLPDTNRLTALYLMEHLRHVAENAEENKMNLNNLATVFGPNVIRPGPETPTGKKKTEKVAATFGIGALDVMSQVSIFRVFLTSKSKHTRLPDDPELMKTLYPEQNSENHLESEDQSSL